MCMTCGCGEPMNRHGDDANITYNQLQAAADAAGIDPEKAADNIHDLAKKVRDEGMPDGPPQESPGPPDAPVETPEADPRTQGAPDPERPASVPADPDTTEEQIQDAFD
jgi:hypothetical protein